VTPRWRRLAGRLLAPTLWIAGLVVIVLGNAIGGLALVMAGVVARSALRSARRREELEHLIDGLTVGDVMETASLVVAPHATLDTFEASLDATGPTTVARVMQGELLVGLVGLHEVEKVSSGRRSTVHASEAMVAAAELPVLVPDEELRPAADRLGASSAPGLPVVADGRLAGILTRMAVGRTLHEREVSRAGAEAPAESSATQGPRGG
jgi:predicted transcriptional regulator